MAATSYQHQRHNSRPLKILNRDDHIFMRFKSQIIAKRKSAVELLQETKPLYVKSEIVLDRKQELPRSLRGFQLPNEDLILNDCIDSAVDSKPDRIHYASECCYNIHDPPSNDNGSTVEAFPVAKNPRLIPPPPAFRKSTNSVQLQNELRKLLNDGSEENLVETDTVVDESGNLPTNKRDAVKHDNLKFSSTRFSTHMISICHKSLPDLTIERDLSFAIEKSDNASYNPTLCSVSSDGVCKKSTHTDCVSLASCKNDYLYASADFSESQSDYNFKEAADAVGTQENSLISSPVKSCASFITPPPLYCDYTDSDTNPLISESTKNRPVSKRESDTEVRTLSSLHLADIPLCDSSNLNMFFDHLGLETDEYNSLTAPRSNASSPLYFLSDSSVISIGECASDGDIPPVNHTTELPSIVERNARIIKWLCNCRKALEQIPRFAVPQCHFIR